MTTEGERRGGSSGGRSSETTTSCSRPRGGPWALRGVKWNRMSGPRVRERWKTRMIDDRTEVRTQSSDIVVVWDVPSEIRMRGKFPPFSHRTDYSVLMFQYLGP